MFIHAMMATEMATASVISVSEIDCWRRDRAFVWCWKAGMRERLLRESAIR